MALTSQALKTLLFVDDEPLFKEYVSRKLSRSGYQVLTASHWEDARKLLRKADHRPDVVFVDLLSLQTGLHEVVGELPATPVVVLSAVRDSASIVRAIRDGARDYICKPVHTSQIDRIVAEVSNPLREEQKNGRDQKLSSKGEARSGFVCSSPKMLEIQQKVLQIADARVPVLILGESGVGKDVIARLIHQTSNLSTKPFVKVNCAALPAELTESELFGYQKGAFTGANIDRPGKFEFANGGAIFLDEIAEFTPAVQAKLLQVLQDGRFTRLGSNQEISVDVRIIAATNRRLEEAIEHGRFRQDLYYRLNVVSLEMPPLRDRKDEILPLCDYFIEKYRLEFKSQVRTVPEDLKEVFLAYHWPGNVRELENTIKRYIVLQDADAIREEFEARTSKQMTDDINSMAEGYVDHDAGNLDLKQISKKASLAVEKNMIVKTLRKTSWNKWRAAKELRVSYKTLLTKIEQYDIKPSAF